jgi:hypothetical protein
MITGLRSAFVARCRERGYTLDDVLGCIVNEDGDTVTVDETHEAYPRTANHVATPAPAKPLPPLTQRIGNFAASATKHVAAGMAMATQEQIDARYAICQGCEFLSAGSCSKCGCPLVRERQFFSKLSWAHESCPVGKWQKIDRPG